MNVEKQNKKMVQLLADEVYPKYLPKVLIFVQVFMMDKNMVPIDFLDLLPEETDLTMFTIQNLTLFKREQLVIMAIELKRKVATELLTTYLPTSSCS